MTITAQNFQPVVIDLANEISIENFVDFYTSVLGADIAFLTPNTKYPIKSKQHHNWIKNSIYTGNVSDNAYNAAHVMMSRNAHVNLNIALVAGSQRNGQPGPITIIDCDSPAAVARVQAHLDRHNVIYARQTTATAGNKQFIIRTPALAKNVKEKDNASVGVRGAGGYGLVFPSVVNGRAYCWEVMPRELPVTPWPDLAGLGVVPAVPPRPFRAPRSGASPWPEIDGQRIPPKTHNELSAGAYESQRNTVLFYAMRSLCNRGVSQTAALSEALAYGARCSPPMDRKEIERTVKSAFSYGRKDDAIQQQASTLAAPLAWQRALAYAESANWHGRTGKTDKAVFTAMAKRCKMDASAKFRASQRELMELASISGRDTVSKSLKRLTAAGLIKKLYKNDSHAQIWCFGSPVMKVTPLRKVESLETGDMMRDAFWRKRVALAIYLHLLKRHERIQKDIAKAVKAHAGTVSKNVRWLISLGLVQKTDVYRALKVDDFRLAEIAHERSTLGKASGLRERHEEQRSGNADKILLDVLHDFLKDWC